MTSPVTGTVDIVTTCACFAAITGTVLSKIAKGTFLKKMYRYKYNQYKLSLNANHFECYTSFIEDNISSFLSINLFF